MKILKAIKTFLNPFSGTRKTQQEVKECQLLNILKTEMFRKMSVPDKITSLAKLAALFQADFNKVPKKFSEMMVFLNRKHNHSVLESLKQDSVNNRSL
ncbi:MAG TPA: hypothetical protein VG737_11365 [Cyclobacteriaceae bacterium]|nr:hypothetical protein [Cyclobacteriaceae bacterium]